MRREALWINYLKINIIKTLRNQKKNSINFNLTKIKALRTNVVKKLSISSIKSPSNKNLLKKDPKLSIGKNNYGNPLNNKE